MVEAVGGKVCFCGDTFSGKTSLINRLLGFPSSKIKEITPTMNSKTYITMYPTQAVGPIMVNYTDVSGAKHFLPTVSIFARMSNLVVITYDTSLPNTFNTVIPYFDICKNILHISNIAIVATKIDLSCQDFNEAIEFSRKNKASFICTSALNDTGLMDLMNYIIHCVSTVESANIEVEKNVMQIMPNCLIRSPLPRPSRTPTIPNFISPPVQSSTPEQPREKVVAKSRNEKSNVEMSGNNNDRNNVSNEDIKPAFRENRPSATKPVSYTSQTQSIESIPQANGKNGEGGCCNIV